MLAQRGSAAVPDNFTPTVPAYDPQQHKRGRMPTQHIRNPQTTALLDLLGLPYNLDHGSQPSSSRPGYPGRQQMPPPPPVMTSAPKNPEEIDLDDEGDDGGAHQGGGGVSVGVASMASLPPNPEEIDLGDGDDDDAPPDSDDEQGQGQTQAGEEDPMFKPLVL